MALADARGHKVRAEDTGADLVSDQTQVLVKRLGETDHGVLAHVVHTHVGRCEQARHAGGVDDVAPIGRIGLGGRQHHGREQPHPVDHTPDIDTQHPFPVAHRVFPDQSTGSHARVVEDEVGGTETLLDRRGQGFHLPGIGHIHLARQHRHASGLHLGLSPVQRILLNVHQHQIHAQPCTDARAFEAKARASAGQNGGLAFEVRDHDGVSW